MSKSVWWRLKLLYSHSFKSQVVPGQRAPHSDTVLIRTCWSKHFLWSIPRCTFMYRRVLYSYPCIFEKLDRFGFCQKAVYIPCICTFGLLQTTLTNFLATGRFLLIEDIEKLFWLDLNISWNWQQPMNLVYFQSFWEPLLCKNKSIRRSI